MVLRLPTLTNSVLSAAVSHPLRERILWRTLFETITRITLKTPGEVCEGQQDYYSMNTTDGALQANAYLQLTLP